jgi:hypothetical protein
MGVGSCSLQDSTFDDLSLTESSSAKSSSTTARLCLLKPSSIHRRTRALLPSLSPSVTYTNNPSSIERSCCEKLLPRDHPRLKYVDHLPERGLEMSKFATSAGMEGIVGKRADSPYESQRSRLWLKMKQAGFHDGRERPLRS